MIEEIGLEGDSERKEAVAKVTESQSEAKRNITNKDNEMFERFVKDDDKSHKKSSKISILETSNNDVLNDELESLKIDLSKVPVKSEQKNVPTKNVVKKAVSPRSLGVPQSSFQFQADYKSLKNDKEAFYQYLKVCYRLTVNE